MKKLIVEQLGYVQVEANRRFVIEVPDEITKSQAEEMLDDDEDSLDGEGMEWFDDSGRGWVGFDVEYILTELHDTDTILGSPSVQGLKVIKLDAPVEKEER